MKILHVVPSAIRGGVEKNCYFFIQATPGVTHELLVLGADGPMGGEWLALGVRPLVLNIAELSLLNFRSALKRSLPTGPFDKVIVWTNSRMAVVANTLNKYKTELYFHIGNPVPHTIKQDLTSVMLSFLFPARNVINARPVSTYVQQGLKNSRYYRNLRAKVSMKPIASPPVQANPPVVLSASTHVNLGMVARLDRIKDHQTVISAFSDILKEFPLAMLHLAGDGDQLVRLRRQATDAGIEDKVIFYGDVADPSALMKSWHLFLYATTPSEGLGGTVAEALAMGLPVVASDLSMVREWDPTSNFVIYCRPSDPPDMARCAVDILKNFDGRIRIFGNAPGFITDNYSPASFAANYISQ
jgi:glycosyltransferase involved in cell wall biosynthesis